MKKFDLSDKIALGVMIVAAVAGILSAIYWDNQVRAKAATQTPTTSRHLGPLTRT